MHTCQRSTLKSLKRETNAEMQQSIYSLESKGRNKMRLLDILMSLVLPLVNLPLCVIVMQYLFHYPHHPYYPRYKMDIAHGML